MKSSIAIATLLVVGAGAVGASAFNIPTNNYQGSDTLFNLTQAALNAIGIAGTNYIGGGSGNGQAAMAAATPTQQSAPMSRMINNGNSVCNFPDQTGDAGSGDFNASSLVVALDAVDIYSSIQTGGSPACSGGATGSGAGTGLVYSGGILSQQTLADGGAYTGMTWKDALALIYGGKNNATGVVDCNQPERIALASSWSQMFQNSCANTFDGGTTNCADTNHNTGTGVVAGTAPLWHAFRRDDASGTSDLFATVLGLSPSVSTSAVNGFGTSGYCNALNWDTTNNTANTCLSKSTGTYNPHEQYIGPGGVPDPNDPTGIHRMPPPGLNGPIWGSAPPAFLYKGSDIAFDVLPTSMQDNDPIRRPCIGSSLTKAGEQVCNIDGSLGLVLPFADNDFILKVADPLHSGSNLVQYPAHTCDGSFIAGAPPNIFHCAPANVTHGGECQNGDIPNGGLCQYAVDKLDGFGQCNAKSTTVSFFSVRNVSTSDGRAFNLWLTNGTLTDGAGAFAQFPLPAIASSADFGGAFGRIHSLQPGFAGLNACQLQDMTDNIACNTQADPCSIGYSGDGGKTWNTRVTPAVASPNTDSVDVFKVYPQTSSVQLLGLAGEYPIARKLYYGSLTGWSNVTLQELTLAEYETSNLTEATTFDSLIGPNGFFQIGAQSPGGTNAQFCEDFDEQTICGAPTNTNGCLTNPAAEVPTANTVCGNGTLEAFEECDDGASNGAKGDPCTNTCRCVGAFPCSPSITCSATSVDTSCQNVAVDTACTSNAGAAGTCTVSARPNTCVCQP